MISYHKLVSFIQSLSVSGFYLSYYQDEKMYSLVAVTVQHSFSKKIRKV